MKTHQQTRDHVRFEADLDEAVRGLFRRYPALCGFSVQDGRVLSPERQWGQLHDDLFLADAGVQSWLSNTDALFGEIAVALLDLIDERPEARELLRGRTFARSLH